MSASNHVTVSDSIMLWYSDFFCSGICSFYGSHLLHNMNSSWVPLTTTFTSALLLLLFFFCKDFSLNSYFGSSSAHKIVHPSRAQDACDPLVLLHLPAPLPPPPVHRDKKARKGQRPQSSKTHSQRRQVQIGLCEVPSVNRLLCNKPWLVICVRVRSARRRSTSDPFRPDCKESTESRDVFVDCQDRRLASVPASQTWSRPPKHLLLARNRIKVLREGVFFGYDSVSSLDLQQNQISFVEEGAFQGLRRLTTLLLQHNRLETLSEETLIPMPSLTYLRLYDNPWNCLCPLDSLVRTLQVPGNRNLGNHAR